MDFGHKLTIMSLCLLENLKFILIGSFDILGFCVRDTHDSVLLHLIIIPKRVLYKDFNFYT